MLYKMCFALRLLEDSTHYDIPNYSLTELITSIIYKLCQPEVELVLALTVSPFFVVN